MTKRQVIWTFALGIILAVLIIAGAQALDYRNNTIEKNRVHTEFKKPKHKKQITKYNLNLSFKLQKYKSDSTPLVFTLTDSDNHTVGYVIKQNQVRDVNIELPKDSYELNLVMPLNADDTAYDTSLPIELSIKHDTSKTIHYNRIKHPDPALLSDTAQYLTQAVDKAEHPPVDPVEQYRIIVESMHYISHRDRTRILRILK